MHRIILRRHQSTLSYCLSYYSSCIFFVVQWRTMIYSTFHPNTRHSAQQECNILFHSSQYISSFFFLFFYVKVNFITQTIWNIICFFHHFLIVYFWVFVHMTNVTIAMFVWQISNTKCKLPNALVLCVHDLFEFNIFDQSETENDRCLWIYNWFFPPTICRTNIIATNWGTNIDQKPNAHQIK